MTAPAPDDWDDDAADLAALFARTAPEVPPFIPASVAPAPVSTRSHFRRSILMKLSALTLTAAGLAAAAVWLNPSEAAAKVTFQDVREAVEAAPFVAYTVSVYERDGERRAPEPTKRYRVSAVDDPFLYRLDFETRGTTEAIDANAGRAWLASRVTGQVMYSEGPPRPERRGWHVRKFREMYDRRASEPETVTLEGRALLKFRLEAGGGGDARSVWVDPDTRLPVRTEQVTARDVTIVDDITLAEGYDAALFGGAAPGALAAAFRRVEKTGRGTVPPPPPAGDGSDVGAAFAPKITRPRLTPGEGFGPLRLGMSRDEVIAATGISAFAAGRGEFWVAAPADGLTARGTEADGVVQIYAGDRRGTLPAFTGRTPEGVVAGMSDAEVVRRLGEPDEIEREGGDAVRRYPDRRLAVVSRRDRVVQVITWSPAADPAP